MPPIPVLIAMADPTRCRIIEILRDGPQPVHILASSFDISRPAISRHLRVLKQASLISEKKLGRENRYALHAEKLQPIADWIEQMRGIQPAKQEPQKAVRRPVSQKLAPKLVTMPVPATQAQNGPTVIDNPAKPIRNSVISQMVFDF